MNTDDVQIQLKNYTTAKNQYCPAHFCMRQAQNKQPLSFTT